MLEPWTRRRIVVEKRMCFVEFNGLNKVSRELSLERPPPRFAAILLDRLEAWSQHEIGRMKDGRMKDHSADGAQYGRADTRPQRPCVRSQIEECEAIVGTHDRIGAGDSLDLAL